MMEITTISGNSSAPGRRPYCLAAATWCSGRTYAVGVLILIIGSRSLRRRRRPAPRESPGHHQGGSISLGAGPGARYAARHKVLAAQWQPCQGRLEGAGPLPDQLGHEQ